MRPLTLLACCALVSCHRDPRDPRDVPFVIDEVPLTGFVDPMLGTSGSGNVIPGALVPHGVMRASPDTVDAAGAISPYDYDATRLHGFTHTNLEGPGGSFNGYSQLLVLPTTGELNLDPETRPSAYSHSTEAAHPGFYAVSLDDYGVDVQLTATGHAAVERYTYPAGPAHLVLDLGHSQGLSVNADLAIDGATLSGSATYNVHPIAALLTQSDGTTAFSTLYFYAELSQVPSASGTFYGNRHLTVSPGVDTVSAPYAGGWVDFDLAAPTTVELRLGISHISTEQARLNLAAEVGDASFDEVKRAADSAWNRVLNRVQVEGDERAKRRFYTALYRSFFQPADYTETDGRYAVATSGHVVVLEDLGHDYYTDDWCMWDTFRTSHPWRTLVEPDAVGDIATSLLTQYQQGGWLPKCTWNATGYSRVMTGNPAVPILADAVVKGLTDFDTALAWEAVDHSGTADIDPLLDGACGYINLGTPPEYVSLGYVPTECDPDQSVTMTLEYAYADWTAARMAQALGRTEDEARYDARASNWRSHWNPEHGFMQARDRAGAWVTPFDPANSGASNDFVEGNSWIYSFFVPHDIVGLTEAMGGSAAMVTRLDAFFDEGHFDVSNQPSYHIPWLYAAVGRPDLTQARVQSEILAHFADGPGGLPGNDDAGSTSVWGLLSMLGLYPIAPGDPTWTLSTPQFTRATLYLHPGYYNGGSFVISAVGDPATMPYIASAQLNGEPLTEARIAHATIVAGGTLEVTLSATPTTWGQ